MARSVAQAAKCANGSLVITQAPLMQNSNCDFSYGGCSYSNTSRTQNNCCVTCLGGYYDGNKACSTYGGSCANGSSRLLVLAAPPCCCAAGSRAPLLCCARDGMGIDRSYGSATVEQTACPTISGQHSA